MGKYDPAPTAAAGLLRLARIKGDLTQAEMAARAGVSQQLISAYETGRREPTLPTLERLVAAAGFGIRMRLEPLDEHDESLQLLLDSLPPEERAEIERRQSERAARSRLNRIRGR